MKLTDGMLLFHGSYTIVDRIDLEKCGTGKDFGKGFYVTSDLNQARAFAKTVVERARERNVIPLTQKYGFISSYRFRQSQEELKIHTYPEANQEWLWYIARNRRRKFSAMLEPYVSHIEGADVIIGKVANDNTNPMITTYLNGLFGDIMSEEAIQETIRRLIPEHLVDQYCFLTEKAISCMEFQEARKYAINS